MRASGRGDLRASSICSPHSSSEPLPLVGGPLTREALCFGRATVQLQYTLEDPEAFGEGERLARLLQGRANPPAATRYKQNVVRAMAAQLSRITEQDQQDATSPVGTCLYMLFGGLAALQLRPTNNVNEGPPLKT